jgi:hypothetical protein
MVLFGTSFYCLDLIRNLSGFSTLVGAIRNARWFGFVPHFKLLMQIWTLGRSGLFRVFIIAYFESFIKCLC